jgi:hypothetical protein
MNQAELNRIANNYIRMQSIEVASKIDSIFEEDLAERKKEQSGQAVHHIHNLALYTTVARINCAFVVNDDSQEAVRQYCILVESLEPKFMEIIETLKDFQPTNKEQSDE